MNAPKEQQSSWINDNAVILLLGKNERNLRYDRVALKKLRAAEPLPDLNEGATAAQFLVENPVDLVLCDERLADMRGLEFVALIRLHPRLQQLPVILISGDNRREAVLAAKDAGCSGYLIRPYTHAALQHQIKRAIEREAAAAWEERPMTLSSKAFTRALAEHRKPVVADESDPAAAWCAKGREALGKGRPSQAVQAFAQALEYKPGMPEAFLGMARGWQRQGHAPSFRENLRKAADMFNAYGRIEESQRLYAELKRVDPLAKDPHSATASNLIRSKKFKDAASVLASACAEGGLSASLCAQVARDCHFTDNPVQAATALCRELGRNDELRPEARKLYQRIVGPSDTQDVFHNERSPRFPGLKAVLAVARYTFQAYFQGRAASM
jgi:CheY-like chemotaxis protein